jgi:P-type Ca2+ transporter type 2C
MVGPSSSARHLISRGSPRLLFFVTKTVIAHNRDGSELTGSPTETALVELALDLGLDVTELRRQHPLIDITYRSERRLFMITLHSAGPYHSLAAGKGSPEEVLALCQWIDHENDPR